MNTKSIFKSATPLTPNNNQVISDTKTVDVHFTSMISQEMESCGDIYLRGNLRVDGFHDGNIKVVEGFKDKPIFIHIAKTGKVHGTIEADTIIIDGEVSGIVNATNNLYVRGKIDGQAFYGNEVDVLGVISAQLTQSKIQTTELKDIETKNVSSENIHHLHTRSTT